MYFVFWSVFDTANKSHAGVFMFYVRLWVVYASNRYDTTARYDYCSKYETSY